MKTVYKYKLNLGKTELNIPQNSQPLKVGFQGDDLFMWVLLNDKLDDVSRTFGVYGTGHQIRRPLRRMNYIDTAFTHDGLVFHVFEVENEQD